MFNQDVSPDIRDEAEKEIVQQFADLYNNVLFLAVADEINELKQRTADKARRSPTVSIEHIEKVQLEYISALEEIIEELRKRPVQSMVMKDIDKILNDYYEFVFKKLNMVQDTSSIAYAVNYQNAEQALAEYEVLVRLRNN